MLRDLSKDITCYCLLLHGREGLKSCYIYLVEDINCRRGRIASPLGLPERIAVA